MKGLIFTAFLLATIGCPGAYGVVEDFQAYNDGEDIADVGPWS